MLYNKFLENLILPIGDLINKSSFTRELKKWREIQKLSEEDLLALQKRNLTNIMDYSVEKIPYYKNLNIPSHSDPYQRLKYFPIIKKNVIKANLEDFLAEPKEDLIEYVSSGSSGIQGVVYMNKREQSITRALQVIWWEWAGYKIGTPIVQTGMADKRVLLKAIKDFLFKTIYVRAFSLSEDSIRKFLKSIDHSKHYYMGGYASSLYVMAQEARKANVNDIHFKSTISWGDKMFPHFRELIEKQFHTKVFDTYGCTEGMMMAAQKDLPYYYLMSPHVHMEIVDEQGNEVPDGELGYSIMTRLDSFSMPLVRYYIGDLAVKLPREKYPEKRDLNFPLIERIIGRDTDIIKTASGKFMTVSFFVGILEFYQTIKQFKAIQRNLNEIEIEYIPEDDFEEAVLNDITTKIQGYLKEPFPIIYKKVTTIPPTKSGKPQVVESYLEKPIYS